MLFHDVPRGIREMKRVLRPGGRVLIVAYGDPGRIDFLSFFVEVVRALRPSFSGPPVDPPPLAFQLQDAARLANELASAGLAEIRVDTITEATEFRSGKGLWDWILCSNPIVEEVLCSLQISRDERATLERRAGEAFREHAGHGRVARLVNPVNIAVATRPAPR